MLDDYVAKSIKDYLKKNNITLTHNQFEKVLSGVSYYIMTVTEDSISDAVSAVQN